MVINDSRENVVNFGLFRLARMAQVGLRLELADGDAVIRLWFNQ
jgi:hypothetical protein